MYEIITHLIYIYRIKFCLIKYNFKYHIHELKTTIFDVI